MSLSLSLSISIGGFATGGGSPPPPGGAALKFNVTTNSQYVGAVSA